MGKKVGLVRAKTLVESHISEFIFARIRLRIETWLMNTANLSPVGALRGREDYHDVAERVRAGYEEIAPRYRSDDEIEVTSANHRRLESILTLISSSFRHPIRALDVGCGTGRYFHCLRNTERLVGMDI